MWKRVKCYMDSPYSSLDSWLRNKDSFLEWSAFVFLCIVYIIRQLLLALLTLASAPLWVIPYLIYYNKKYNKRGKKK